MATPTKWNERPEPILEANQRSATARAEDRNWAITYGVVMVASLVFTANRYSKNGPVAIEYFTLAFNNQNTNR
jgi:hypothetical protein